MESRTHEIPAPVHVAAPRHEQHSQSEVWPVDRFHKQLTSPQEFAYENLPATIHLDGQWQALMGELAAKTSYYEKEYSVAVACLDCEGPLLSLPFEVDRYFDQQWGDYETPIFVSKPSVGTQSEAAPCVIPPVIEWKGETVPMKRVGFVHTHPSGSSFSLDDIMWLTYMGPYPQHEKFIAAVTQSDSYFLLRTDGTPETTHQHLQEEYENQTGQPWFISRFRWKQAVLEQNKTLAQRYRLGLYGGRHGETLTRLA